MPRGVIDLEGLNSPAARELRETTPPDLPIDLKKLGHGEAS